MPIARGALYLATTAAIALLARSILLAPIPLWIAGVALTAYIALILVGVFFLRLQMYCDVIWRGPRDARGVALTFDDGPSPEHTPKILDMLDRAKAKATFFVIGRKAEAHPELVKEIVRRGHAIGLHGYAHDRLFSLRSPTVVRADLARGLAVLEDILGERPTMFRPPIGHTSPRIATVVDELDLTVVGWSVRALDGLASAKAEKIAARVVPALEDRAIVLLHDAAENDDRVPASLDALPKILDAMSAQNLEGVRVDAWIDDEAPAPTSARRSPSGPRAGASRAAARRR